MCIRDRGCLVIYIFAFVEINSKMCFCVHKNQILPRSEERRVGKEQKTSLITAILDETLKVTDGSRVRIRLRCV